MSSPPPSRHRGIYGETTGELYAAWVNKVAATKRSVAAVEAVESPDPPRPETLPHEALQPLFNEVLLYPSKSQVFEMVQCARECSNQVKKTQNQYNFCSHSFIGIAHTLNHDMDLQLL